MKKTAGNLSIFTANSLIPVSQKIELLMSSPPLCNSTLPTTIPQKDQKLVYTSRKHLLNHKSFGVVVIA